jgi:hypothetical protein
MGPFRPRSIHCAATSTPREKKSRKDQLEHAKAQAADVLAARELARHGEWGPWCEKAGLEERQARRYVEFGKAVVTSDFQALSED